MERELTFEDTIAMLRAADAGTFYIDRKLVYMKNPAGTWLLCVNKHTRSNITSLSLTTVARAREVWSLS